ncbi:MAG: prepilin-type N-terminal cleavage/methylation domain-containing protein [Candidatus Hydrogenedentes bacterium]|nr:prepilin-type N-terminal cleavage/methylation domain-containing protein [Candidatus Hydrogenedentota bacterium]
MGRKNVPRSGRRRPQRIAGFTLIEVLVALAVLSVSIFIFVDLFVSSVQLGRNGRVRELAASIAEDQLQMLVSHPDRYRWQPNPDSPHALFPVLTAEDEPRAGNAVDPPGVLPIAQDAHARTKDQFDQFRWKVFARLADDGRSYELTTAVYWEEQGRDQVLTLTGAIPAGKVEGAI